MLENRVSRTISGFETVINWFYSDAWLSYHSNDTTLEELWSIAQQSNDFDYHVGPHRRTKNLECEYINIKFINLFPKEIYNIEAENICIPLDNRNKCERSRIQ